jgi:hypothetical protein
MAYSIQACVSADDLPMAVAMFSFFRGLGQTIGIALGEAIFQNSMQTRLQHGHIPEPLVKFYSKSAVSAVEGIKNITDPRVQGVLRHAYTESLRYIWIACGAFAACAFLLSLFVGSHDIDKEQESPQSLTRC